LAKPLLDNLHLSPSNPDSTRKQITVETILGVLIVAVGGLVMGAGAWPMKLMRTFQFEHWWFLSIFVGLAVAPWTITLVAFPHIFEVYSDPSVLKVLILSNLLAFCWGIANILCGLCYVRIGIALTQAILTGLGVSVVVTTPLIFKGSGLFKDAPDVISPAGLTVLSGVGVMLIAVVLASLAGFGRDRELEKLQQPSGSFLGGLIMTVIAGVFSAGLWLAFIYSQGSIVSRVVVLEAGGKLQLAVADNETLSKEYAITPKGTITLQGVNEPIQVAGMTAKAAADKIAGILKLLEQPSLESGTKQTDWIDKIIHVLGISPQPETHTKVRVENSNMLAMFAVWAAAALSGALLNLLYPAYLMTKNKSWGVLTQNWKEVGLSIIMGAQVIIAIGLPAKGMIMLGTLGASIGAGIQQAMQMLGGQGVGFISGEWRGVLGKPRRQMYGSIALLILAALIMAISKKLK
jgi:hypothetical protein